MGVIDKVIGEFYPGKQVSYRKRRLIEWVFAEHKIAPLLQAASGKQGLEWVESIVESLELRCEVHSGDYDNIPSHGPVIVIANHPTVVDGLALINTIAMVRKDVKIVANQVLTAIFPQIKAISIGISNMHGKMGHRQFKEMNDHLRQGGVLIICPAGRLASISLTGIRESRWQPGFIRLATKYQAALLPVHISGVNSPYYYLAATLWRPLSNLMFLREIAGHQGGRLRMRICSQIALPRLHQQSIADDKIADEVQRHLVRVGKGKPGGVATELPLARPEQKSLLINAFSQCRILKTLGDGKVLFHYRYQGEPYAPILQELGRLREIAFRAIGAGSGKRRDNDGYDHDYHHVILWDPCELEVVGAYRITPAGEQIAKKGVEGLYSHELFHFDESCLATLQASFEIGRGFIQERYQKTHALDALWKGIFCFVIKYPEYKYLLGVLTIPNSFPTYAQALIVSFYQLYFSGSSLLDVSLAPYQVQDPRICDFYAGNDFEQDWKKLNNSLRELGCALPWPYKQMARWFNYGGSTLLGFRDDNTFNSVVGLSLSEIASLKKAYYMHYIAKAMAEPNHG